MNSQIINNANWYHAATLAERVATLATSHNHANSTVVDIKRSQRRLQRWKSQTPFTSQGYFAQRLGMDGLTEELLITLLGEPIELVANRFKHTPLWISDILEAFYRNNCSAQKFIFPEESSNQSTVKFLALIKPLIHLGYEHLHEEVKLLAQEYNDLPFNLDTIAEILLTDLPSRLTPMLSRTMILEMHIASLQGFLTGNTSEQRFNSFIQRLHEGQVALTLLEEYPVLARQLVGAVNTWVNVNLELIRRLCEDWEEIKHIFSSQTDIGVLVKLDSGMGDRHREGRSVTILKFSSGFQVVYKPRSLSIDAHFQDLLKWINEQNNPFRFQTLKVIDRDNYGWVQFVTAQSCTSIEQVQNFYQRLGGYLALLYVLEATDFHSENIMAAGEHPVLVDLESLFHPRISKFTSDHSDLLAARVISHSVMRVGLLPERMWSNSESAGIDVSGLGGAAGQLTPKGIPTLEGIGTDQMRFVNQRLEMVSSDNRPTLDKAEVSVLDYTDEIITGFTNIYQLLLKQRDNFLAEDGPLARFGEDSVRVLLRSTHIYNVLLRESFHPDMLRDGLDRERFLDRLWIEMKSKPHLLKVVALEQKDLEKGDIPIFTTRPNSHDLWSSSDQKIVNFIDVSGMELVKSNLKRLSNEDLARQIWFIRASLTTLSTKLNPSPSLQHPSQKPETHINRDYLLSVAHAVGDQLEALALRNEEDITWIGITSDDERYWVLDPLGLDLYDGLPGITLFLAYLGTTLGEERYTKLALDTMTTIEKLVEVNKSFITKIGAFTGWGAIIYTMTHLGQLWKQPEWLDKAESLVKLLPMLIKQDQVFDLVEGSAGCIVALLALYHCRPSDYTLRIAIQCGDWLITTAQPMQKGIGWGAAHEKPLAGFSHGNAGIALALLELATMTGEARFHTAAVNAIAYERTLFYPKSGNWLDLRSSNSNIYEDSCVTAWCHGAPGIGLARLRSLPHLDDADIRAEIDVAIKTTLAQGFGMNHSLCHGDLGNIELLLQASQLLDDAELHAQTYRIAAMILGSIEEHGWLCGVPMGVETPGLMTGLAGIGYQLLRLAAPERVPSVLTLEPPRW